VVGTLVGVMFTQRRADRRDETTWQRTRQREREVWDREDSRRTFDQRQTAYLEFYSSMRVMMLRIHDHVYGFANVKTLEPDFQMATLEKLRTLAFYAPPDVAAAAEKSFHSAHMWGCNTKYGDSFGEIDDQGVNQPPGHTAENHLSDLLLLTRADLHIESDSGWPGK
jgi:hypothetical protein